MFNNERLSQITNFYIIVFQFVNVRTEYVNNKYITFLYTGFTRSYTYLTLKVITYKWWIKSLQRKKCKHIIKDWFKFLSFDRHLILTCSSVKSSLDSVADCPHVGGTLGKWWLGGGQDVTTLPGQQHDLLLEGVYLLGLKLHQLYQSLSLSDVGLPSSWKLLTLQKRTFTYIFVLLHSH